MAHRLCPWWLGYFLANPMRRIWQEPRVILAPFVSEGMLVLEPGCGMGFFTIELARLVGPHGKVLAMDVQPKMLTGLQRRARRAGMDSRIEARVTAEGTLKVEDVAGAVDFALAFAVVHELPDQSRFFAETYSALKNGGRLLLAEPKGHVTEAQFAATRQAAERAGFRFTAGPAIRWSRTAVLERR